MAEAAGDAVETADPGLACVVMGDLEDRQSPLRELSFSVEGGEGLLCYGAPSARERVVMGELVPWGEVWRLGANEPTTVHLSAASSFGGVPLQAGSYSLYAIPGEDEWEFHLNSNYERWGIPIDAEVRARMATPAERIRRFLEGVRSEYGSVRDLLGNEGVTETTFNALRERLVD